METSKKVGKKFLEWEEIENIEELSEEKFERLPFGAIQLDTEGRILRYNQTEGQISGRDPEKVIGKDFFNEVAPCTNVQEFGGRFRDGVAKKDLNAVFPYTFDYRMEPTRVWVRLFYSNATDSAWVFVSRQDEA